MSSTILNDIVRDYEAISGSWFNALGPIASKIFWILVAIQLTWSAIWWVMDREDGLAVVSSLLRQIVAIGFFYGLLLNGGTWVPAVIQSFSQAGATAAGLADLSPTGVFDQGLALANKILNATSDLGLLDGFFASLVAGITAIVVVIAFAIIAAQLLVALVESFIVVGAGVLFLGFAGSRWTKFFTERYLSYVASIGVKLFVLYLIMGVGMGIAARWMPVLERGGFSPIPFFYVMGGSLVFVFLTWHIPSVAGSMMAGAVSLSLADAAYPAVWGTRAARAGLIAAGTVGGAAMAAGRWDADRLRVFTSLHTGNGQHVASPPSAAGPRTEPPVDSGRAHASSGSEPARARPSARPRIRARQTRPTITARLQRRRMARLLETKNLESTDSAAGNSGRRNIRSHTVSRLSEECFDDICHLPSAKHTGDHADRHAEQHCCHDHSNARHRHGCQESVAEVVHLRGGDDASEQR